MNNRFLRKIALVLVAAQILGAPLANAFSGVASAPAAPHCAEQMPAGDSPEDCPCCPDGGMNASACLSACTLSVGWIPVLAFSVTSAATERVASARPAGLAAFAEPPLKPPPIA
ncbi:MAG TPA: hypothetical protein VM146_09955 [Steroidobacteraceae bacterium]|nr:hypothetical protein [Steroidobacteraceae bacterium]